MRATAFCSSLFEREAGDRGLPARLSFGILELIELYGPLTPTSLELESGLAGTTLRERVQALSDKALVARLPNPDDKRSYFLAVTQDGTTMLKETRAAVRALEQALEHELGSLEAYREPLERLRGAAQVLFAEQQRRGVNEALR
jgi:DNA-binding MarR family transcriptional regulator